MKQLYFSKVGIFKVFYFVSRRISACVYLILLVFLSESWQCNAQPCTVEAGNNFNICFGSSTMLNAIAGGGSGVYNYSWICNPPGFPAWSSNQQNPIVSPLVTTVYTVTATDGTNPACTATDQVTVTVNPLPNPNITGPTGCAFSPGYQYTTLNVPGHTYVWNVTGGSITSGQGTNTILVFWNANGTGTVYVTETITSTGCSKMVSKTVAIHNVPVANFTPPPPSSFGCSSVPINFFDASTSMDGSINQWSWNFGNAPYPNNTSTQKNPTHTFTAYGTGSQAFNIQLIPTTIWGCKDTVIKQIIVLQGPDPSIDDANPVPNDKWRNCVGSSGPSHTLVINNISTTASTNTHYHIDWGDPFDPVPYDDDNLPNGTSHTYSSIGNFPIVVTVTNAQCSNSKTYYFFNGSNPSGGIDNPGNTTGLCGLPQKITFTFTPITASNPPGTIYIINFDDGTIDTVTQPPPDSITHYYTECSCGHTSQLGSPNAFSIKCVIKNPCGTTNSIIDPVEISTKPDANFTISPLNVDSTACSNTDITFTATSQSCGYVDPLTHECSTTQYPTWSITPQTGWTVVAPTTLTTSPLKVNFSTPGNYTIKLISANGCGSDTIVRHICISPTPVASFTTNLNPVSGCIPLTVTVTNNSTASDPCGTVTYTWSISNYTGSDNCPPNLNGSTISDIHAANPAFTFTNPGVYTIKLVVQDKCNTANTTQTVTVRDIPHFISVSTTPTQICAGQSSTPTAVFGDCNSPITGWSWTFEGSPPISSQQNPGPITYPTEGTKIITVQATNICGSSLLANTTLLVKPLAAPTISGDQTPCLNDTVIYTTEQGNTNYIWVPSGGSVIGPNNTYSVKVKWTSVGAHTISVNYQLNGCPALNPTIYNVNVAPLPVPTITGPQSVCDGAAGIIYLTEAGMSGYSWTITGGTITLGQSTDQVTVTWTSTGSKTLCVNYTDLNGCKAATPICYTVTVHPLPVPTITPPDNPMTVCINSSTVFSTEAGMQNYVWTSSTGATIAGGQGTNSIIVNWPNLGLQTITVTYTDNHNCDPISPTSKAVNIVPLATPTITGPSSVCKDSAYTYTTEAGMSNYNWIPSSGGTVTSGQGTNAVTIYWSTTGPQWVKVNYENLGCPAVQPTQYDVTVNARPNPTITGNTIFCADTTGVEYSTQAGMINYTWNISAGGTILTGLGTDQITVKWNTAGAQWVSVNYQNSFDCPASSPAIKNVTVNPRPSPTIAGELSPCVGNSYTYSTESGMTGYIWSVIGGGTITTGMGTNQITVLWHTTGSYSVCVTYTNLYNCPAKTPTCQQINVINLPIPTITGPDKTCVNKIETYCTEAGKSNYIWSVGPDGTITGGTGTNCITVSWPTAGAKTISANYTQTGCPATSPTVKNVTVNNRPVPTITSNNSNNVCIGSSNNVYTTEPGMSVYIWNVSSGGVIIGGGGTGDNTVTVQWITTGAKTVCVNYTVPLTGCEASSPVCLNVTVNPLPIISISGEANPCNGTTYTYTTQQGMTNYQWAVSAGGTITGGGSLNDDFATIKWNLAGSQSVSVNYVNLNGCTQSVPVSYTVTVKPVPVGSANPVNQMVCSAQPFTIDLLSNLGASTTFSWTSSHPSLTGPSTGTSDPVTASYINPGTVPSDAVFTIIPSDGGCAGTSFSATVTVNPVPQVTTTPLTQNISSGNFTTLVPLTTNVTGGTITFNLSGIANPPNITGLLPSGNYSNIPSHQLFNPNTTVGTVTYTITPSINGCSGPPANYVITIQPTANVGVDPVSQTICSGDLTTPITFSSTVQGTTFSWSATTIPPGITVPVPSGIGSPIPAQTIINNNYVQGTVVFTVTPSLNGVPGIPMTCEIIVNPKPDVIYSPAFQVLCSDTASAAVTLTSNVPGTTFGWKATSSGSIQPGSYLPSGNGDIPAQNIVNNGTTPGSVTFAIGPSTQNCQGDTVYATIIVNPRPLVYESIASQQVCSGSATSSVLLSSNIPTATFSWYSVPSFGNLTGYTSSGTGNILPQNIINPNLTAETVTYYIYAVSQFGPPCNGDPITHVVTVIPRPEMTCTPINQSICSMGTTIQIDFSADITGTGYTWNGSAPSFITGYILQNNTSNIPPQSAIANSSNLPGDVDYVITPWYQGCDGTPVNSVITVNPGPIIINTTDSETICSGESSTGVSFVSTVANANYKWHVNSVTATTPPLSGYLPTGYGPLPSMILNNDSYEIATVIYEVLPFILNAPADTCFGPPFIYSIIVNPRPDVIASPPSPQTVCSGAPPSETIVLTSNVLNTSFSWIALNPPPELSNFTVAGSADIPTQIIYNSSNVPQFLVYTITPTANGCPGTPVDYVIQVNPLPLITFDPPSQVICSGETTLPITISSSVANTTYTWSGSSVAGVTGYTNNGAGPVIPSQTIYNLNNTLCQVVYTISASADGCQGLIYQYIIDVSPKPSVTNSPMSEAICSGGTSNQVDLTSNVSGTSFSWISLPGPGITGATSTGGNFIPPQTLYNAFNTPGYVDYAITPTSHLGKECSGNTVNYRIDVLPEPHITNTSLSQETCSGELTDEVILTSDVAGTIFQWTSQAFNVTGNTPSGTGNIPPETLITDASGGSVTYTIIPTVGNCTGVAKDYIIYVKPMPQITNTVFSETICSGETTDILITSDIPGVQFSWTASLASGSVTGFSPAGTSNPIKETLINPGIIPGVVAYRVVVTLNGCTSSPVYFFVTVNPPPTADFTYLPVICLGETTHFYDASVSHAQNGTLTWEWNFDDPGSGGNNTSTIQNPTHVFTIAGVYHVRLVVTDTEGCKDTIIKPLFFNPAPVADFTYSGHCFGLTTQFSDLSSAPAGTLVSWDWNFGDPNTGLMNTSSFRNPSHDFSAPGTYNVTLIVHDNNLCSDTIVKQVVIDPSPLADFSFAEGCVDTITVFHDLSTSSPSPIVLWEWDFGDTHTTSYTLFTDPVTHLYAYSGQYLVTLTVHDANGCSTSVTQVLNVYPLPTAMFQFNTSCSGQLTYFTDFSNGSGYGIDVWNWNFGDPGSGTDNFSDLQNPTHIFASPGNYSVQLCVSNTQGCVGCVTQVVAVNPSPVADFTADTVCKGQQTSFNNLSYCIGDNITSWKWDFGDGSPPSYLQFPVHTYQNAGPYLVSLTVTTQNGCKSTIVKEVVVHENPVADFTYSQPGGQNCFFQGEAIQFTDLSTIVGGNIINTWYWDFGDGGNSSIQNPSHTYSTPGTYYVTLTVWDINGCHDATIKPVILNIQPVAAYAYSIANCDSACFTDSSIGIDDPIQSWFWNFGDTGSGVNNYSTEKNPCHIYYSPLTQTYTVMLVVTDSSGCSDTAYHNITISKPVPDFTFSKACIGEATQFYDQSVSDSNFIASWSWDFGDLGPGNSSTQKNPIHIYNSVGTYTVTLTVTNGNGCSAMIGKTVVVSYPPSADWDFSKPNCYPDSTHFLDISSPQGSKPITGWFWVFGDGDTSTDVNPVHKYPSPGTYTVTLTVNNSDSCFDYVMKPYYYYPGPTAAFSYDPSLGCTGGTLFFHDLSVPAFGNITGWDWDFGDNTPHSTQDNPSHVYLADGTFTVILIVTDERGCTDTMAQNIVIHALPVADFNADTTCLGKLTQFHNVSSDSTMSWLWNFGEPGPSNTSTLFEPQHTYQNVGDFYVTLTATDLNTCSNDTVKKVTVVPIPIVNFTYSNPCSGQPVQFTDESIIYQGSISGWSWDFGDPISLANNFSILQNPVHIFTGPGIYTVILQITTTGNCPPVLLAKQVEIRPGPEVEFSHTLLCYGQIVQFTDLTNQNGGTNLVSWNWNFDDPMSGNSDSSVLQNPPHLFSDTGNYDVRLIVANADGCIDTLIKTVTVHPLPGVDFTFGTACQDDTTCFQVDPSVTSIPTIVSYSWDLNGDGIEDTDEQDPCWFYSVPGMVYITLTVTDINGCVNHKTHILDVKVKPLADFVPSGATCEGYPVFLDDQSSSASGYIEQWTWHFDDGSGDTTILFPGTPDIFHVFPGLGPYNVRLSVTSSIGCKDSILKIVTLVPGPVAAFKHDSACESEVVHFTDMSTMNGGGLITSWNWNFGESSSGVNNTSNLQNPTHIYSTTGTFNVRLVVGSANGCVDTIVKLVIVIPRPIANFKADTACLGSPTHFTDLSVPNATGFLIYSWNFGDGSPVETDANPIHTYTNYGYFSITLTVTNQNGCENTVSKQVLVMPLPVAAYSFTDPNCLGAEVCFTDHSFTQPEFSDYVQKWIWDFGDGTPADTVFFPDNPDTCHVFADQNSSHLVRLTVISSKGCESFIEKTVNSIPAPVSNFSYSNITCAGQMVIFNDDSQPGGGGNIVSWSWNFGDPVSGTSNYSTLEDPGHIYASAGDYSVTLIVTDENNCSDTRSKVISINKKPVAKFTADTVCDGTLTQFTDLSIPNADTIIGWSWNFGDNSVIQHERNPQHLFPGYGIYPVSLTVTNSNGCIKDTTQQVLVNPNPAAAFNFIATNCQNQPVCYSDMTTFPPLYLGHASTWIWDFGDGTDTTIYFPNSPNVCHIFAENALSHIVRLTVTSSDGCVDFIEHVVNSIPAPVANFDYTSVNCEDQPVHFNDLSQLNGGGNIQWSWNFGDPGSGVDNFSTLKNPDHTYAAPGAYSVKLTVTNTSGCFDTITKSITINAKPVANFKADTACFGTPTHFNDLSTPNASSIISYSWNFGDGSPMGTQSNPEHTYGSYGLFSVTLTIENSNGCTQSITRQVLVNPLPMAAFTYSSPHCSGSPICFTNTSTTPQGYLGTIVRWFWEFGDGTSQNVKFPANPDVCHIFTGNSLTHAVRLTVITSDSCSHYIEHTVNSVPSPIANFMYSTVNCASQSVNFTDMTALNGGGPIISWNWDFGDPTSGANNYSSMQNPSHSYATSSSFIVRLIVKNITNCTDTITDTIQINQLPVADFTADTVCVGSPMTFIDKSTPNASGIIAWSWNFGDGSLLNPTPSPVHTYNSYGVFTVTLKITNSNGCIDSISKQVLVNPLPIAIFSFSATACQGAPVCYDDQSTTPQGYLGRIDIWQWDFGDGSTQPPILFPNNPDVCHTFLGNAQSHVVKLTVTTTDGCVHFSEHTVNSTPSPVANFSWNTVNCVNSPVLFSDQTQLNGGGPIVTWNWNFGDPGSGSNNNSQQKNPVHSFTGTGPFMVTLIVNNTGNCPDTIQKQITINELPTADFSADSACVGSQTSFTDESVANGGVITTWQWNFGDGSPVNTQKNPNYTYATYGLYNVTLTVTNSNGCINTKTSQVLVLPLPLAAFSFTPNVCKGSPVQFTDNSTTIQGYPGAIVKWKWDFGDGTNVPAVYYPGNPSITHVFAGTSLSYTVKLTVTTASPDSCSHFIEHTVTLIPQPLANFSYPAQNCEQQPVAFMDQSALNGGGPIVSWKWDFGDPGSGANNTSNAKNPVHLFTAGGGFYVTLIAFNSSSCSDTIQKTIWISDKPFADFHADTACKGTLTNFTDLSTIADSIVTHQWEFGDGGTSTQKDPTHLYSNAGLFNVKLTVTTNKGCIKDTTKQVQVNPVPTAAFTFSTGACTGDSVQFTDLSATTGSQIVEWYWEFGDGGTSSLQNPGHVYANANSYNVTLTVTTADSCTDAEVMPIVINPEPAANFEFDLDRCPMTPIHFTDLSQSTGGIPVVSWLWDFGDPASGTSNTSTQQNPDHSFTGAGNFNVFLTVTNATGCQDTITKVVDVNAKPIAQFTANLSCTDSPTQFIDMSSPGSGTIVAWQWNFNDPASGTNNYSNQQFPTHTYSTPGTYHVSLMVTNSNTCTDDTIISVWVTPKPIAFYQYASSCATDSTLFTDLSIAPNSQVTDWHWDFDDGGTSDIQNPRHAFMNSGTYNVKLVIQNIEGCKDSIVKQVHTLPKPVADFEFNNYFCPSGKVEFFDISQANGTASIETREWTFEPGQTSNEQNPVHVFGKTDTTYLVTLIIIDDKGCSDTIVKSVYVQPGFDLDFTYDNTACFGQPTAFHAQNSASGDTLYDLHWIFGDPASGGENYSTLINPSHQFTNTGDFVVRLRARNSDGCVDSLYKIVQVQNLPEPAFSFITSTCDSTVQFQDGSSPGYGSIAYWIWFFGDGSPPDTIFAPGPGNTSHKYGLNSSYQATLIVQNAQGCRDTVAHQVNVTCISADIQMSMDTSLICTSNHVVFHDNSVPQSIIVKRHWKFGDPGSAPNDTSSLKDPEHIFSAAGIFTISLEVITLVNGDSISSTDSIILRLKSSSIPGFTGAPVCDGMPVHFINTCDTSVISIKNYHWNFGDGIAADTFEMSHLYRTPDSYNVTLRITNQFDCVDSISSLVRVYENPTAFFSGTIICSRDYVQLADSSLNGDTTLNYWSWKFTDTGDKVTYRYGKNPVYIYDHEGEYPVYLKVKDLFQCSDDTTQLILVLATPVSSFNITESYENKQGQISLNNLSTGATSYLWDFGNGKTSDEEDPVTNYTQDGTYLIKLISFNDSTICTDTTIYMYELLFKGLYIPTAFAPTSSNLSIRLFKPAGKNLKQYNVQVYDYWGDLLWESSELDSEGRPLEGWDGKYNGEYMPQGNYMWKASAVFIDDSQWEGSDIGTGKVSTMGTVSLIR